MLDMGRQYATVPTTCMGGPRKAIEHGRMLQAAHADGMMFRYDFGVQHEHAMESLEIFAKEVILELRSTEAEQLTWREQQIKGIAHPIVSSI
jgi:ABC-type arginine/histidine transport system permease subunit